MHSLYLLKIVTLTYTEKSCMSGRGLAVSIDPEVTSPFVKSKDGKRVPEFSLSLTGVS